MESQVGLRSYITSAKFYSINIIKAAADDALKFKPYYAEKQTAEVIARNKWGEKILKGISKNAGRTGIALGGIGIVATSLDGVYGKDGWEDHHTADIAIQGILMGAALFAVPGVGWVAGGYFLLDIAWQSYSGNSITESMFD